MTRIIVTGGAGFIGCNFVRRALQHLTEQQQSAENAQVIVFDKLTYAGSLENLREVENDPRYRFIEGDIADRDDVRKLFADVRPTALVNFAAESHVDRSIDGPGEFVRTNIVGTFELLEAARGFFAETADEEREAFRFVHVSTDEVYGSLGAEGLFEETTAYSPNSPYAASKASADHLARAYFKTYALPVVITNCSNNYGPFQFPEKLIPLMILNTLEAKDLPIYGDGMQVRDWLYVEDHCDGIWQAMHQGRLGQKYNIGGHNERANIQVVDRICELLEEERPAAENPQMIERGLKSYGELKKYVTDRPGHDRRYAIDSSKIQSELGWKARHDFESGMRETVRWYLQNRDWCRDVADPEARNRIGLAKKEN